MRIQPTLAAAVLCMSLGSQDCVHGFVSDPLGTLNLPGVAKVPFPLARGSSGDSWISQFTVSHLRFQNAPFDITGLAFALDDDGEIRYSSLRVRMGHAAPGVLQSTFASNFLTPPVTVLETHDYVWPHRHGQWNEVGLQSAFTYTPAVGNLLIEIVATGITSAPNSGMRHYSFSASTSDVKVESFSSTSTVPTSGSNANYLPVVRVCADLANLSWSGESCPGSGNTHPALGLSGTAVLGGAANVVLSNALPARFCLLGLGFDSGPPYPLALGSFGMPGCSQYLDPSTTVGLVTNATGVATHTLNIPSVASLGGFVVFGQYYVSDAAANSAGIVSTNLGRVQLGL